MNHFLPSHCQLICGQTIQSGIGEPDGARHLSIYHAPLNNVPLFVIPKFSQSPLAFFALLFHLRLLKRPICSTLPPDKHQQLFAVSRRSHVTSSWQLEPLIYPFYSLIRRHNNRSFEITGWVSQQHLHEHGLLNNPRKLLA